MTSPAAMEPMLPESSPELESLALALTREAAALGGQLHPLTRAAVADLLRSINTYHSNLIEGHDTRPRDIERALAGDYARDPQRRALQLEARAHIEVQVLVEHRMESEPGLAITSTEFLRFLHREFYQRLPESLREVRDPSGRERRAVEPGALRSDDVQVGRHVPPEARALPGLLERFEQAYDPARLSPLAAVAAAAASHHRLLWIHPFLDGNGRVARLYTDAYLRRLGLGGQGLWTASRGLARARPRYLDALAAADAERWNEYDGRGARSHRTLVEFCGFLLETCLDQIRYMESLLRADELAVRVEAYVERRAAGGLGERLPREARHLLSDVLLRGEIARGDAARVTGTSGRTARRIVARLVREGLLRSLTPKGSLRLGLPSAAVPFYFPQLYPEEAGVATDAAPPRNPTSRP